MILFLIDEIYLSRTCGRPEDNELRVIYVLDFGMARKYTKEDVILVN
jgi:hypothetical protein